MLWISRQVMLLLLVYCALGCTCSDDGGFEEGETGYAFKRCATNPSAPQPSVNDMLVGDLSIKINGKEEIFSTEGTPERLFWIDENPREGSLEAFLLTLHLGDSAIMIIPPDADYTFIPQRDYRPDDRLYLYFSFQSIVQQQTLTSEEKAHEEASLEEQKSISTYLKKNNLTIEPEASGLYFREIKKGEGIPTQIGKTLTVFYTVKMVDGRVVQTNVLSVAKAHQLQTKDMFFEPFEFVLGDTGIIPAWTEGLLKMREGGKAQLIVPSYLAYGAQGSRVIPPFTPLVFELEVVGVEK